MANIEEFIYTVINLHYVIVSFLPPHLYDAISPHSNLVTCTSQGITLVKLRRQIISNLVQGLMIMSCLNMQGLQESDGLTVVH